MAKPNLNPSLATVVKEALNAHLEALGEAAPENIYRLVLDEIEKPMLEVVMKYTHGNQSGAAIVLGINRATLRVKLNRHGLL